MKASKVIININDLMCCGNCSHTQWTPEGCWCVDNGIWIDGNKWCEKYTFDEKNNDNRRVNFE
jgi:hypothetical protein